MDEEYSTSPRTAACGTGVPGGERKHDLWAKPQENLLKGNQKRGEFLSEWTAFLEFGSEWINMVGASRKERCRMTCA